GWGGLRMVEGMVLRDHGLQKVFGTVGGHAMPLTARLGAAGIIETVCGSLITLGFYTAPAAFIASGEMAFAYFTSHAPRAWFPIQNGGELAVLFCFLFLYFATRGNGRFSIG